MKRLKFFLALLILTLAFPAYGAATNPFMDVPLNHWAYDAIGQLAAHGILSGYPDGTYNGRQVTTRYEMASALARALAVVDMTKASVQDAEMMKRLVVEFKDELEALGVSVSDLDERVSVLEDRLGGWHIHVMIHFDADYFDKPDYFGSSRELDGAHGRMYLEWARMFFERWFGNPDNPMHFQARFDPIMTPTSWQEFFVDVPVEMPLIGDATLTFGRFAWDLETNYYHMPYPAAPWSPQTVGAFCAYDSLLTDRSLDGIGFHKNFSLGQVWAYVSHTSGGTGLDGYISRHEWRDGHIYQNTWNNVPAPHGIDDGYLPAWEAFFMAALQFNESFGFDFGGQVFIGDNAEQRWTDGDGIARGVNFENLWTVFGGLRFRTPSGINLRGIVYHQQWNGDSWNAEYNTWADQDRDAATHWRAILFLEQSVLKFTSAWIEVGGYDEGFIIPTRYDGQPGVVFSSQIIGNGTSFTSSQVIMSDMDYWRVILSQRWNKKWGSHIFYSSYDFKDRPGLAVEDVAEYGIGINYSLNDYVDMGFNYMIVDWDDRDDNHVFHMRTAITF